MRFQCTHCRGILAIEECEPGEAVACGHCGTAVAVPESRMSPGAIVGDFILRELLGQGGMGTVYLAHQISLDRVAALKVLHGRYGQDEAYIRDFIREARAAAAINHPNIVQAYAVGEDDGLFFFAMEYVPGSTLKQVLLHGGRLVPERALDIGLQVAGALDFAWRSQGLVHRDIKPDNIILTADAAVKLADLGLARKLTDTAADGTQELHGTPQYIAPEHMLGSPGDNRSDIYSLGATLFHALTGRFPYEGASPVDIAQKHLLEPLPSIRTLCSGVPPTLAQVVEVMLAKRPQDRYPDAAALLADLELVRQNALPAYAPTPSSQLPIDLEGEEAVALSEGRDPAPVPAGSRPVARTDTNRTTKRRFSVSRTVAAGGRRAGATTSATPTDAGSAPATPATAESPAAPSTARSQGRGLLLALVALAVLVLLGGAVVAFLFFGRSGFGMPGPRRPPPGTKAAAAQPSGGLADALEALRQAIAGGLPEAEVRTRLAALVAEYGYEHPEAEALQALAAPYVEADLQAARGPLWDAERQQYQKAHTTAKAAASAAAEAAQAEAAAQAERQRQEQEAQRLAAEKAERDAAIAQEKQTVRTQAAELCRRHEFTEAERLFVPLTAAQEEDLVRWARLQQATVALAERLFESIVNSKEQLAGLVLPVPSRPDRVWRVSRIGFKDVELQWRLVTYSRGERQETIESLEIPFADLIPYQLHLLTERRWQLDGRDESERNLLLGAYLLARHQYLADARARLEASGRTEATPLLEELALLEPEWRRAEAARLLEEIRLCVQRGDAQGANARATVLRRDFPAEAETMQDDLRDLMGGR